MKRSDKYNLGYFESGDVTSPTVEMQRFETLDAQLSSLFSILGNGILNGWDLVASSGLVVAVAPGSGHVAFVAVESTENAFVNLTPSTTNYIYAQLKTSSYWDKSVQFFSSLYLIPTTNTDYLYLGNVTTDANEITSIDADNRTQLGFVGLINSLISQHRHIGGTDNPQPINLATDVQGTLNQSSLPEMGAEKLAAGVLDEDRIPILDHITKLTNQGALTHSQLDSFVETLSLGGSQYMGEVSTANLLQLLLALKHVYPDIDEYLVNSIAFIPGISPDEYIDTVNTTATVDTRTYSEGGEHKISGAASTGFKAYTRIWNTEDDFLGATSVRTYVNSDTVSLSTKVNTQTVDNFSSSSGWSISTDDKSAVSSTITLDTTDYVLPPSSGKIAIGKQEVEVQLLFKKEFNAQDWSAYNYLSFYIKTEDVEHGDIIFYLNDSVAGDQNSYQIILDRNSPTINVDTLENGWQEIIVDITRFTRENINTIGFYLSTQSGWDASTPFDFNIDGIILSSGNIYEDDGYIRFIYGGNTSYRFWRVRWDAFIPSDSESSGVSLFCRTRVANTLAGLPLSIWSPYSAISGTTIPLPTGSMYKYIEVEMYFTTSTTKNRSAILNSVYLDFYLADSENSFEYDSKEDWEKGILYNIDTQSSPGSIKVFGSEDVNNILYGTDAKVVQLDSNLSGIFDLSGTRLPRSTYQILNGLSPSFSTITSVCYGNMGSLWLCDTDNDRVVEVDRSGKLLRGFFGSYLYENVEESQTTTTTTTTIPVDPNVLSVLYNNRSGALYVIFDRSLTTAEISGFSQRYIRIGTNYFRFDSAGYTTTTGFEHVVKYTIDGAEKTALDHAVLSQAPAIVISSPLQQQRLSSGLVTVKFLLYDFVLGTSPSGKAIKVTLDGTNIQTIYSTSITYSGLSVGSHTIKAQLLDENGNAYSNIEAVAEGSFVISNTSYTQPYISFNSPRINQVYSSVPVTIDFKVENFAIVPTGQHIRYVVDTEAPVDYYSTAPIVISDLSAGKHTITIYTCDSKGSSIYYTYGSAAITFIVGKNSLALPKLYYTINGKTKNLYVDVEQLVFTDVYAPFDVQYIPASENGKESVLMGKLTNQYVVNKIG